MDFTGEDAAPAPNRTLDNTGWYDLYDAQLRQMQIPQPLPQLPFGYNNGLATYPPQPMYPQHGPAVVTERAAPVPAHPQNLEYEMPLQTPTEEPDPSTRPRLTTDQTNILESRFQQDPKPLTNTKRDLAQKIGLTLDKVNVRPVPLTVPSGPLTVYRRTGIRTAGPKPKMRRSTSPPMGCHPTLINLRIGRSPIISRLPIHLRHRITQEWRRHW